MQKINQKTALVLSLLFALATAWLWNVSFKQRQATAASAPPVLVVVPRENIQPRTLIKDEMLRFAELPAEQVPGDAYRNATDVAGKVAQAILPAGKPITMAGIESVSPAQGLPYILKPGMRAVTVAIDPVSGVAGFMKAGDKVDVLATYSGNDTNITRTILQDIELLAIGNRPASTASGRDNPNEPTADAPTATLAVYPEQSQVVALAAAKAKIHLTLRSASDQSYTPLPPTTTGKVFGFNETPRSAPAAAPAPAPMAVREIPAPAPAPRAPEPAVRPTPPASPAPAPEPTIPVVRGTQQENVPVPTE